jgi:SAM-dependent methyltransferase
VAETSQHDLASQLCTALQQGKPANIALMQLVIAASRREQVDEAIDTALVCYQPLSSKGVVDGLCQVSRLWKANPQAWRVVRSVSENIPHDGASRPQTISDWACAFDRAAATEPDAGVALYSFGNPALLEASTAEIVDWLNDVCPLAPHSRVLDIGCGGGRLVKALASRVELIVGVDISAEMIRIAEGRCRELTNVRLEQASGQDLRGWSDSSFHLILAVDVFPYVVPMGHEIVHKYLAEARRVLKNRGTLIVLNFSYRGDLDQDRSELASLAAEIGLEISYNGISPFKLWDGIAFVLVQPESGTGSQLPS